MKRTFTLPSPETKTHYAIFVSSPRGKRKQSRWPVMVFLDGDNQFSAAVAAYRRLRRKRRIPPLLLVGVGYGAGYGKPANRRGRDYTPTPNRLEPNSGGAEPFLRFLIHTLWPELRRRYPVDEARRGIGGHSLGSLFALYALCRQPRWFTHILSSAPAIWWDNRSILKILRRRRTRSGTLRGELFLSAGEKDSESMAQDLSRLERQLVAEPFRGLRTNSRRFANRDHFNVLPDAFTAGLAELFGRKRALLRRTR